jgi:hypothetical protein
MQTGHVLGQAHVPVILIGITSNRHQFNLWVRRTLVPRERGRVHA